MLLAACTSQPSNKASASASPSPSAAPTSVGPSATPSTIVTAWSEVASNGTTPAPREDHTWTVAPDGGTAYLFGGRAGSTLFDDLWAYDLATDAWSEVSAGVGPQARFGHNAVWADGIGLVVFAGQAGANFFNDLWAYDPTANAWKQLPASGAKPVSRYGSCAAIGPDGRLWISHGFTSEGARFADTRAYDFATDAWTDETPAGAAPIKRCLHACWWTDTDAFILYGGQTVGVTALGDRWALSPGELPGTNAWSLVEPDPTPIGERNLYAAARWGDATVVFGGESNDAFLQDAWLLIDGRTAVEVPVGALRPPARSGAELIADPARGRMLLFGGRDGPTAFGDLWQLTLPPR